MINKYFSSIGFSILMTLFLAVAVSAAPGIPCHFYGDVTINGVPAPDGVVVDARVSGNIEALTTTVGGTYGEGTDSFYIADPQGTMNGKTVEFYVQDIKAGESVFNIANNPIELNLAVSISNFCGDGQCDSGESCTSCSEDCGTCVAAPPSGGGSAPSGGSSTIIISGGDDEEEVPETAETCEENWICTDWTNCVNGEQSRTCADVNRCGTEEQRPVESQNCEIPAICEPTEVKCYGNDIMSCSAEGDSWILLETCEYGCSSEGRCLDNPFSFTGLITGAPALIGGGIVVLIIIAVLLYTFKFKKK